MVAASLVPTVVQRLYYCQGGARTGTPLKVVGYLMKVTKVTQSDWIVVGTYLPQNGNSMVMYAGVTVDSSLNGVQETMTYTTSGDKLALTSATVGTTYVEVDLSE